MASKYIVAAVRKCRLPIRVVPLVNEKGGVYGLSVWKLGDVFPTWRYTPREATHAYLRLVRELEGQ